jgi:hypothetical protein
VTAFSARAWMTNSILWLLSAASKPLLSDMVQRFRDRAFLWLAFMLFKVIAQLLLGFFRIHVKFRPRAEGKPADIAERQAGRFTDESHDLEISLRHRNIMARQADSVKSPSREWPGSLVKLARSQLEFQ